MKKYIIAFFVLALSAVSMVDISLAQTAYALPAPSAAGSILPVSFFKGEWIMYGEGFKGVITVDGRGHVTGRIELSDSYTTGEMIITNGYLHYEHTSSTVIIMWRDSDGLDRKIQATFIPSSNMMVGTSDNIPGTRKLLTLVRNPQPPILSA
jgi:hypothetical protein